MKMFIRFICLFCAISLLSSSVAKASTIGGVNLGNLTDYLLVFTDGSAGGVIDFNLQGASKGYAGDIAVNGVSAGTNLRTSGTVPFAGTMHTNAATLDDWQGIVDDNRIPAIGVNQAFASFNQVSRLSSLQSSLTSAFTQINALPATAGYSSVLSTSLNGLNTQNGISENFVINVTSGLSVSSKINITGDASDSFILRWDTDANFADGYEGQVKFQSGGGIVPLGGLTAGNFVHVAGDINASGGGTNPASPYPQGPRLNDGTGALITGGSDFNGGGFFTGYWLTTGDPSDFQTSSLSNAIFVGGWYSTTSKFSMTSGTSGVHVKPIPEPTFGIVALATLGMVGLFRRKFR
jgi:hypothetical protein